MRGGLVERFILKKLPERKKPPFRKLLILKGVHQVNKTESYKTAPFIRVCKSGINVLNPGSKRRTLNMRGRGKTLCLVSYLSNDRFYAYFFMPKFLIHKIKAPKSKDFGAFGARGGT